MKDTLATNGLLRRRWAGATLLLLGMGLDEFSMSAISVPRIKKLIRNTNFEDVKAMADQALSYATAAEIEACVDNFIKQKAVC